jgi:hypothetical protein
MADRRDCDETRALTAELALGVAAGDERAKVVKHLETCATCRGEIASLVRVLDEVLLLVPEREPPAGFESRLLAKMMAPRRPRRWRRITALSVAAAMAAALSAGGVWLATGSDRQTAETFRTALERAGGVYFGVEFLHIGSGMRVGHAFVYGGTPSWVFVVIQDPSRAGTFDVDVVTHSGETLSVGSLEILPEDRGAGLTLPVDLRDVSMIRMVPRDGGESLEAELPAPPSSSE